MAGAIWEYPAEAGPVSGMCVPTTISVSETPGTEAPDPEPELQPAIARSRASGRTSLRIIGLVSQ